MLVVSLRMWTHHTAYESVIAQALRLRGAEVAFVTCGGGQPICEVGWGRRTSPRPCDRCSWFTDRVARQSRLPHLTLADEFPWGGDSARAPTEPVRKSVDPRTTASAAWFAKSADPVDAPDGPAIERDFRVSVEGVASAFERIVDRLDPDVVFAVNGLFAAEHAMRSVAERRELPVVTYELAPRKDAVIFGREHPAPDMVMDGLADDQASRPLSPRESDALDALLHARVSGESAHERYFAESLQHEARGRSRRAGAAREKPVVSAFTNLSWDTALLGKDVAFESQFDWLAETCRIVGSRADTTLVIRVHPGRGPVGDRTARGARARRRARSVAGQRDPRPPDRPLSSYGLLAVSKLVLCYTTTVGLEAAVRGVPVAVAAETHYRGRGFTSDIASRRDLESCARRAPGDEPGADRARTEICLRVLLPPHDPLSSHRDSDRGRLTTHSGVGGRTHAGPGPATRLRMRPDPRRR